MSYRVSQIESLDFGVRWLSPERSKNAYAFALSYTHSKRYGLNETTVEDIQRLEISDYRCAKRWLAERVFAEGTVQIVYGDEVCVVDSEKFIEYWDQIFVPARDDAIVLHNLNSQVLFYCHEEELEFGYRVSPIMQSTRTR
jgi:hypothetical protein